MLTLTDSAKDAVRDMLAAEQASPGSGLRIAADASSNGDATLSLELAQEPVDGDEVVGEGEARVFLDPMAASLLEDKVLDAEIEGNAVEFKLYRQAA
jgi:Fe-S cluster assembly iron-binding protein IscA